MEQVHECFVIAPIGGPDSSTRKRTDQLIKHIIEPAAQGHYTVTIAHKLPQPGKITIQVVEKIVSSALLVADLTDSNANVFYELSLRHVLHEPDILLIQENQIDHVPFDLRNTRITPYDLTNPDKIDETVGSLREQIAVIEQHKEAISSAIGQEVSVIAEPQGPSNNVALLGSLLIANRFHYELIEPFFETLYSFEERLTALRKAFRSVMRQAARKKYLRRETTLTAFTDKNLKRDVAGLYDEVGGIISALNKAMQDGNEKAISEALMQWRINNSKFFRAWSQQYGKWLEQELPSRNSGESDESR